MTRRWRAGLLLAATLWAAPARASQDSERLVAQGEVAYQAQRYDDARGLYARAAAADPHDAAAQYGLGLALGKLGRWDEAAGAFERALQIHPGFSEAQIGLDLARAHATASAGPSALEPTQRAVGTADINRALPATQLPSEVPAHRPWGLHASAGVQYDSNVTIEPTGNQVAGTGDRGDVAFTLSAGGRYDILDRPDLLLRFEYDFYQTLHPNITDFDFQSHRVRTTAGYALLPWAWVGTQVGYDYYLLGRESYLSEPYVTPFVSFLESTWGLTQLSYRHGADTYLSHPFHDLRDGPVDNFGIVQTLYQGARYLTVGWDLGLEHPTHGSKVGQPLPPSSALPKLQPSDYDLVANQAYVGVGSPTWWRTNVDLMYLFRYEDYTRPNSRDRFHNTRQDSGHHMYASLTRPITDVLSVVVSYYGTVNLSNIPVFDYRRNVAGASLQVAF